MKRRGFLGLLGLAPAVPLIAKELVKESPPVIAAAPSAEEFSVRYEGALRSELTNVCMCTLGPTVAMPKGMLRMLDPWGGEQR
jgi:hypothetical protein